MEQQWAHFKIKVHKDTDQCPGKARPQKPKGLQSAMHLLMDSPLTLILKGQSALTNSLDLSPFVFFYYRGWAGCCCGCPQCHSAAVPTSWTSSAFSHCCWQMQWRTCQIKSILSSKEHARSCCVQPQTGTWTTNRINLCASAGVIAEFSLSSRLLRLWPLTSDLHVPTQLRVVARAWCWLCICKCK